MVKLSTVDSSSSQQVRQALENALAIPGVVALALVDVQSATCFATAARGEWSRLIERAALANVNVVRAKKQAIQALGLKEAIEDILITLESQYHLIRPIEQRPDVFLYAVLARAQTTLVMARFHLLELERTLRF